MKIYYKKNTLVATHDDAQDVPVSAYGEGVSVWVGQAIGTGFYVYWENGIAVFTDEIPEGAELTPPIEIPQTVSKAQAKIALDAAGLLDDVETMILSPETPRAIVIAYQDAQYYSRNSPLIQTLGAGLGLSESEIDELFITAAKIQL